MVEMKHFKDATSYFKGSIQRILDLQRKDGSITWFSNGIFDPWNHLESVMALNILKHQNEKKIGFQFLKNTQLSDGSWNGQLGSDVEIDEIEGRFKGNENAEKKIRDTNFTAYIATACWHDYLINESEEFLKEMWPTIEMAITFVLSYQSKNGEVRWAAQDDSAPDDDALLTGCCSIYKSLECAINCASILNIEKKDWRRSLVELGNAIKNKPEL